MKIPLSSPLIDEASGVLKEKGRLYLGSKIIGQRSGRDVQSAIERLSSIPIPYKRCMTSVVELPPLTGELG